MYGLLLPHVSNATNIEFQYSAKDAYDVWSRSFLSALQACVTCESDCKLHSSVNYMCCRIHCCYFDYCTGSIFSQFMCSLMKLGGL